MYIFLFSTNIFQTFFNNNYNQETCYNYTVQVERQQMTNLNIDSNYYSKNRRYVIKVVRKRLSVCFSFQSD